MAPKLKGWPKGLKNKVYILNPEFNKETWQLKLKLSFNSKLNIAFYIAYTASLISLIYNNPKIIKEVKSKPDWLKWKKAIKKEYQGLTYKGT